MFQSDSKVLFLIVAVNIKKKKITSLGTVGEFGFGNFPSDQNIIFTTEFSCIKEGGCWKTFVTK